MKMNSSVGFIENKDVKSCSGCKRIIPPGKQCLYKYNRGIEYYCTDCTCNMLKVAIEDQLVEKEYQKRRNEQEEKELRESMYNSATNNGFAYWFNNFFH